MRQKQDGRDRERENFSKYGLLYCFYFWNYINFYIFKKINRGGWGKGEVSKTEYKQKQMKQTVFHMNNITTLKGCGRTNPRNFGTHYFDYIPKSGGKQSNPQLLRRFASHKRMGVGILKLFYVYYRTQQMSKCDNVVGSQDSFCGREIFLKNGMKEGKEKSVGLIWN